MKDLLIPVNYVLDIIVIFCLIYILICTIEYFVWYFRMKFTFEKSTFDALEHYPKLKSLNIDLEKLFKAEMPMSENFLKWFRAIIYPILFFVYLQGITDKQINQFLYEKIRNLPNGNNVIFVSLENAILLPVLALEIINYWFALILQISMPIILGRLYKQATTKYESLFSKMNKANSQKKTTSL